MVKHLSGITFKTLGELRQKFPSIRLPYFYEWVKRGFARAEGAKASPGIPRLYCEEDVAHMCSIKPLTDDWMTISPSFGDRLRNWRSKQTKEIPSEHPLRRRFSVYCPPLDRAIELVRELHLKSYPIHIRRDDFKAIERSDKAAINVKLDQMTLRHRGLQYTARRALAQKHRCSVETFDSFRAEFGEPEKVAVGATLATFTVNLAAL